MSGKIINIGTLDVRGVTNEFASQVEEIANVGTYITNDEAEKLMSNVPKKNIGDVIKLDEDVNIITENGALEIDQDFLEGMSGKSLITCNGKMVLNSDIKAETLLEKVLKITLNGKAIMPSHLKGPFSMVGTVNGKMVSYPSDYTYLTSKIDVNDDYLLGYFGPKKVAAQKVLLLDDIDVSSFAEVIDSIHVMNTLMITQANLSVMRPFLDASKAKVRVFKEKVHYIDDDVVLTEDVVKLANGKLLVIDGDVECDDLSILEKLGDAKLSARRIVCDRQTEKESRRVAYKQEIPVVIKEALAFENYGDMKISKEDLVRISSKENKSLENYGLLSFDRTLKEEDFEGIEIAIKNFGLVKVSDEIYSVVNALIVENRGKVSGRKERSNVEEDLESILYSNMGVLTL